MGLTVTYNGFELPGVYGSYSFGENYEEAYFSCNFLVESTTPSGLITARAAAEDALREPLENLTIEFSGNTHRSFSHDSNTGMNPKVEVTDTDHISTEIAQSMSFRFRCQLPADKDGFDFRQSSSSTVSFGTAGERNITFSLVYTAGGSNSATENYDNFAEAFAEAALDSQGGSGIYELVSNNRSADDQNKVCSGTLIYREVLDDDTELEFNNSNILKASAQYSVTREQDVGVSSGGYDQSPSVFVSINYSCVVEKSVSVANTELLYRNTIKPWLIKHSKDVVGLSNVSSAGLNYITRDDAITFDPTSSTISGRMSFFAPGGTGNVIALSERISISRNEGKGFDKIWNGIPDSYLRYHMGSMTTLTRVIDVAQLDSEPAKPLPLADDNFDLIDSDETQSEVLQGFNTSLDSSEVTFFRVVTKSFREVYKKVNKQSSVLIENVIISEQ